MTIATATKTKKLRRLRCSRCRAPRGDDAPAGRAICRECRLAEYALQREDGYTSYAGGGTSRQFPGHEERMALYAERAAKGLPLFGGWD